MNQINSGNQELKNRIVKIMTELQEILNSLGSIPQEEKSKEFSDYTSEELFETYPTVTSLYEYLRTVQEKDNFRESIIQLLKNKGTHDAESKMYFKIIFNNMPISLKK